MYCLQLAALYQFFITFAIVLTILVILGLDPSISSLPETKKILGSSPSMTIYESVFRQAFKQFIPVAARFRIRLCPIRNCVKVKKKMDSKQQLQAGLQQMGLKLTTAQQLLLLEYVALLKKWNSTYNLTALRDEHKMISHHILDSLSLLDYIKEAKTLMDVGSGGGMPGIPTAICRPDLQITLLDSNTKKTTFLQQVVIELGLSNVTVASGRVEAMHDKNVDVVTSRAFAELADFISLTKHLLNENGYWAAMKGVYPYEELEHVPASVVVEKVEKIEIPMLQGERHMVIMRPKKA